MDLDMRDMRVESVETEGKGEENRKKESTAD